MRETYVKQPMLFFSLTKESKRMAMPGPSPAVVQPTLPPQRLGTQRQTVGKNPKKVTQERIQEMVKEPPNAPLAPPQ